MSEQKAKLEQRLKNLEEILQFQMELGEDTNIVMDKMREVEQLLKKYQN